MTKLKKLILAFVASIALSCAQFWLAMTFSKKILWQSHLMLLTVGPGPVLGYDTSGKPMYEATPVHMVAAYFGLILGVVIYAAIFYFLLKRKTSKR